MSDGRFLCRVYDVDFGIEDHGCSFLFADFKGDGWAQGLGYLPDLAFIRRFMGVFRATRLQECNGRACWVTRREGSICLIEPLMPDEGEPFDIREWSEEKRKEEATP